ncbi:MAG: two-component system, LytTR family, response regulator [Acidobacteriota bacterium]|jgi:two-component system LytT family response regulator|nr:two-component system, LytTR family, response regulator [Acidobacteriota bacterium]
MNDMDAIKVVIVDDEPAARAIVAELLADYPQFAVVAECANGYEAVKACAEHRPDLLFLDIQMPKLDGFEVLELLEVKPKVVFVTAYDEHAVRAFEVHALDYLLKPFTAARFAEVIAHVEQMVRRAESQPIALLNGVRRPLQRIAFREGGAIDVVPVQRIDYIEAQDDYVQVSAAGRKRTRQQTLGELATLLDPMRFVRVHRSYIVNLDSLARVEPYGKDSRVVVLKDGTRIPVSRAGYERLRELL